MSSGNISELIWPASRLEEGLTALIHKADLSCQADSHHESQPVLSAEVGERIERHAALFGCEAVQVTTTVANLPNALHRAVPMLLRVATAGFLVIHKTVRRKFIVISPTGEVSSVDIERVCDELRTPAELAKREEYLDLFAGAGLSTTRGDLAAAAMLEEQFGANLFQDAWTVRRPVQNTTLLRFLKGAGVLRTSTWLIMAHVAEYLLWIAAWAVMGQLSFSGRMDRGWLTGWGLLLLTTVPFRIATTWLQGVLAVGLGASLKRRLLIGALKLDGDSVRHLGVGSFLSQALESEAVETLALSGGVMGLLAVIELVISGVVLGYLSVLLAAWCALLAILAWRFLQRYEQWTGARLAMTGDLIESMVGHRTRLAQMDPENWHGSEDGTLADYFARSRAVDSTGMWLVAGIPRGWLIAGLLWLVPSAISGTTTGSALAVKLGGILLAFTALKKLTAAAVEIGGSLIAGRRTAPLFQAAAKTERIGQLLQTGRPRSSGEKILEADRVMFRYPERETPALHPSSLTIRRGEKILLEGSSGGGKTTFASLLSGMRKPASGLLLLNGLDAHTTGLSRWRRTIAAAPQFHENYIFTDTLAFNLLLGRQWPPSKQDVQQAEALCRQLGLGELLERMPGGIEQMVGEGGWQLSHGERSRIYVARTLLQNADLVILDESFGALDPENLQTSLESTLAAAETLLVIAHP